MAPPTETITLSPQTIPPRPWGTGFLEAVSRERAFIMLLGIGFLLVGAFYQEVAIARWLGFLFAAYAAIGNDSIQTIGTFIASNKKTPWWGLWLFMGGIFLATVTYSWITNNGDVSFGRLSSKGFAETPTSFAFLSVAAPLFLVMLTRLKMPVSTTFLLLTSLSTDAKSIGKVLSKSLTGYGLAFVASIVIFFAVTRAMQRVMQRPAHPGWRYAQWITSGLLWSAWLAQDAANIAVYLPRQLGVWEFVAFAGVIFVGLGILFKTGGEKIQEVVDEKSDIFDVRAATMIDFIYAIILYYFKIVSDIPMSTTWVFLGLLAGRELAMSLRKTGARNNRGAMRMIGKDLLYAGVGLLISILIAAAANEAFRHAIYGAVGIG